ncbi:NAD(P)H-dependent oxidoreductase [Alicyclobacillus tolerans]|uniref:NADPH-dependent FMN reductase n=1 Tax=Alicyclobacillus tolerans TaxID=90970 RepID=UPI001F1FC600|nr:NADPH-dependent FMN reductase [Alicyclobacillus tolerans]MCF8565480.1 NAD(P)H-dependent oxidoreductase [Alicyclobacillus tolerans]
MPSSRVHIVGLCGSLRKHSCNRGLLNALKDQFSSEVVFTIADLSEIPLYNPDNELPYPDSVLALASMVNQADGLVISSPEYNLSYTAVLKNTLEWLSRRSLGAHLAGKPTALIGTASINVAVSQSHLRDVLLALNLDVLTRPIVQIVDTEHDKFDDLGNLIDVDTVNMLIRVRDALLEAIG